MELPPPLDAVEGPTALFTRYANEVLKVRGGEWGGRRPEGRKEGASAPVQLEPILQMELGQHGPMTRRPRALGGGRAS